MVKLGDICDIKSGGTPSRSNANYWNNGNIPWIKISDFNDTYIENTEEFITKEGLDNSSAKMIKKGSILFTIFATLGEVAILNIDATTNQAIASLTITDESVKQKYLYYFLCSLKDFVNGIGRGVAQNNINLKILKNISVPIPSSDKQNKIIKILDNVNCAIDCKKQQLLKLDELVKSRFIEMFGDPVINSKNWSRVKLGKRCDIITGNTPSRSKLENYGTYIEWVKSDNINTSFTYLTEAEEYLSKIGFQKCRFVDTESILMTCIAGSINCIGNVAIANRRVAFNQQINAIVPKNDNALYIYWLMILSRPAIHRTINMALKGILSKGQLSKIEFPFPPMELQEQFSNFAKQIDKSKLAIEKSIEKLEILKKSLMQEYFG